MHAAAVQIALPLSLPVESISRAVWLCHICSVNLRDIDSPWPSKAIVVCLPISIYPARK